MVEARVVEGVGVKVERPRTRLRPDGSRRLAQTADLAVAHAVVHEVQQLASDRDSRLVLAAALGDAVVVADQLGATAGVRDRLDGRPPNQAAALLGGPAAVHGGVGLVVLRCRPAHGHRA